MSDAGYPVPAQTHRTEQSIERSRFIATIGRAASVEDARALIESVRADYPDATHSCWAFVAGPPGSTAHIGMSDAGEPHGTAGRPMLDVLMHSGVGEIAAVVSRYFGGVKLGKGGLVRAYGGAVQHALDTLPTTLQIDRITFQITVGYADVELLKRLLVEVQADVVEEHYGVEVRYVAAVPRTTASALEQALADGTAGRARLTARPDG